VEQDLGGTFALGGDWPVRRIGFGAMRLTGPGIWGPPRDPGEARAVLRRAVDLGVNFIDTAESYGPYVSEELIAEALYPYPHDVLVATKGGLDRSGPDSWQVNGRPERLREALDGSLRRLKLEQIPLYQLHRIDPQVPAEDQFGVLQEAQRSGKVRHLGLSEASVTQIAAARKFFTVVSVQNQFNLADRHWDDVLAYCSREKIAFIPWYPLQIGDAAASPAVQRIAAAHALTPGQLALAWLLACSDVVLPIPGTSRVAHLEENLAAGRARLTDAEMQQLDGIGRSGRTLRQRLSSIGRRLTGGR